MKTSRILLPLLLISLLLILPTCKKSEDEPTPNAPSTQNYNDVSDAAATAAIANTPIMIVASQVYSAPPLFAHPDTGCPQVTRGWIRPNLNLTLDWGTGCNSPLTGLYAQGSISATGTYQVASGADLRIAFNNFAMDSVHLDGAAQLSGTAAIFQVAETLTFTMGDSSASILFAGQGSLDTNSTLDLSDDTFTMFGSGTYTGPTGLVINYSTPSDDPLVLASTCLYPLDGKVIIALPAATCDSLGIPHLPGTGLTATIDYCPPGSIPTCDDLVRVTIGTYSQEIHLSGE